MKLSRAKCKCGTFLSMGYSQCLSCTATELSVIKQELYETKQKLSSALLEAEQHKSCPSLIKVLDSRGKELGAKLDLIRAALA